MGGARKVAAFKSVPQKGEIKREKLPFLLSVAPDFDCARTETENSAKLVLEALKSIGRAPSFEPDLELEYSWFLPETPARVEAVLAKLGAKTGNGFIASAMASKNAIKNWPEERFLKLYRELLEKHGAPLLLLGGENDAALTQRAVEALPAGKAFNLAGKLSLDESAWLLGKASLFVGNDSGPAHMASASGAPCVAFYRKISYARWRLPATAKPRFELVAQHDDINEISVEEALAACEKALALPS
jgi:ADP-heptose:LPS heptosyltransferase